METARETEDGAVEELRRLLLEVDRERGNSVRVQKDHETVKSAADKAAKEFDASNAAGRSTAATQYRN